MEQIVQRLDKGFATYDIFNTNNDEIYKQILLKLDDPEFVKILMNPKYFTKLNTLMRYNIFFGKNILRFNNMMIPKEFSKDFIMAIIWKKYPEYHDQLKPYENLLKYIDQELCIDYFKDTGNCINSGFMESYYMPLLPVNFDFKAAFNYLPNKDKVFNTLYKQGDITGIDGVEKYLERYISDKDFWKNWSNLKVDNKDKLPKKLTKTLSLKQIIDIQEKYDIDIIDDDKLLEDKYLIEILRNLHYPIFEQKFERIKFKLDFNRIIKTPGKYNREINLIPIQMIDLSKVNQHIKDIFIKNTDLRIMFEKTDELTITKDTYIFWLRFFKENFDLIKN
jgi:hypothetical protein